MRSDDSHVLEGSIAVVGCGRMGLPMARRLLDAGRPVRAFDISAEARERAVAAGAVATASPAEAAAGAQIVITMLPDPPTAAAAGLERDGVAAGLREGALWLEMTSSSPEVTQRLAAAAEDAGAALLDAPVSGGVAGAEAGTLTVMLGGPAERVEAARPVLEHLGDRLVHVGDRPGDGDVAKTLNNMLSAANLAAAAEALSVGLRAGLDPERLLDCINGGSGASHASQAKLAGHVISGRFAAGFTIGQYLKDLRIALSLADRHAVPVPVNSVARAVWTAHAARGAAGEDHTRIADLIVRDAGLEPVWPVPRRHAHEQ